MKHKNEDLVRRAFGKALRDLRLQAGLSQEELASQGISRGHISEMEHGRQDPRLSTLMHLAELLGIPFNLLAARIDLTYRFLKEDGNPPPEVHIVDLAVKDGILRVTLAGRAEFHAGLRLYREILDLVEQEQVNRVLMDCLQVDGTLDAERRRQIAWELANYLKERHLDLKLATVGVPPVVNGQGAAAARQRGANMEVFTNVAAALAWLNE